MGGCGALAQGRRGRWLGPGAARVLRRALSARLRAPAHSCGVRARLRQLPRRLRLGAEVLTALRHTDRTRGYSTRLSSLPPGDALVTWVRAWGVLLRSRCAGPARVQRIPVRQGRGGQDRGDQHDTPSPACSALPGPPLVRSIGAVVAREWRNRRAAGSNAGNPVHTGLLVDVARGPTRTPRGNQGANH